MKSSSLTSDVWCVDLIVSSTAARTSVLLYALLSPVMIFCAKSRADLRPLVKPFSFFRPRRCTSSGSDSALLAIDDDSPLVAADDDSPRPAAADDSPRPAAAGSPFALSGFAVEEEAPPPSSDGFRFFFSPAAD